jgi:hypothetical protein
MSWAYTSPILDIHVLDIHKSHALNLCMSSSTRLELVYVQHTHDEFENYREVSRCPYGKRRKNTHGETPASLRAVSVFPFSALRLA